jgi:hemoglobin
MTPGAPLVPAVRRFRVRPTLFEFAAGEPAFLALAEAHHARCLADPFLDCFVRAIDDAELPRDPDFRAALRAYMRWAVDDVLSYSPEHAVAAPGAAMPRWGWDGLQT